jgi:hypothetical protein
LAEGDVSLHPLALAGGDERPDLCRRVHRRPEDHLAGTLGDAVHYVVAVALGEDAGLRDAPCPLFISAFGSRIANAVSRSTSLRPG